MRRAERLFRIIEKLRPGRLMTARDLAASLEVSERTIYRDIAHLVGSGLPIEGEAGVGYIMRDGYDLPPVMFSEEEMVALTAGARMVAAWGGTSMARGAESALEKIAAVVPDAVRARAERLSLHAWGGIPQGHAIRETIDAIEAATDSAASRPHRVHRRGTKRPTASSDRLGLWFWGKVWTLVAWCELRRDFRMFRLDRIAEIDVLDPYTPHPDQDLAAFYRSEAARSRRYGRRSGERRGTASGRRHGAATSHAGLGLFHVRHDGIGPRQTASASGVARNLPRQDDAASGRRLRSAIIRRSSAFTE
jgi:predicted DNA-binding transcriptional regulator YafY